MVFLRLDAGNGCRTLFVNTAARSCEETLFLLYECARKRVYFVKCELAVNKNSVDVLCIIKYKHVLLATVVST